LAAVLTVITGRLLCPIDEVYQLLNAMTGDNLFTHQLVRAAKECEGPLLEQFPHLAETAVPDDLEGDDRVRAWITEQEKQFGQQLSVQPLDSWQHIDPITELAEMRGSSDDIVVVVAE
jgi:hypothetical protein